MGNKIAWYLLRLGVGCIFVVYFPMVFLGPTLIDDK